METPLSEIHPPSYPCPDLSGPADAQRIGEDNVVKDKGPLGVPSTSEYPLPFCSQDGHEPAPYVT